jgi:hypothetical protein
MLQRIINSTIYTVGVVFTGGYFTGIPKTPEQWGILAGVVVAIWWGKFSTSTRVIAPNRKEWTEAERAKAALDELNKGIK